MKLHKTLLAASLAALLVGCGSSDSTETPPAGDTTSTAQFIDGYVQGLYYVNGSRTGYTNADGEFNYTDGNISFYLGNLLLGTIEAANVPSDNKVFVQDLLGVDRNATSNTDVLKMARLLQTLDATPNSDSIEINATARTAFDVNTTFANFPDANITAKFTDLGLTAVKTAEIQAHLEDMRRFTGEESDTTAPTVVSSPSYTSVDLDDELCIEFSERIPKDLITATNFTIDPTTAGTLYRDNTEVCFTPDANLTAGQTYTITADGAITDYSGNALGADASVNYTTTAPATPQVSIAIAGGTTQSVVEGDRFTLDLSASTPNTLFYEWQLISTAPAIVAQSGQALPIGSLSSILTGSGVSIPTGDYNLSITVASDNTNFSSSIVARESVALSVTAQTAQNTLPVLNVAGGLTQSVTSGNTFTIDVSGSTDADGDSLTYVWSLRDSSNTQVASGNTHTPIATTTQIDSSLYPVGDYSLIIYLSDAAGAAGSNVNSTVDLEIVAAAPLTADIFLNRIYCNTADSNTDFINFSANNSTGNIQSYTWTVSGQTFTGATGSYFCAGAPGTRTITLTVEDDTGTTDTISAQFNVIIQ